MLSEFLHTSRCSQCGKVYQTKDFSENEKCGVCNGSLEYKGFQPKMDKLAIMIMELEQNFNNEKKEDNEIKSKDHIEYSNGVTVTELTEDEAEEILKEQQIDNIEEKEEIINEEKQQEPINEELQEKDNENKLTIDMILDTNARVSNAQVIPALKDAIFEKSTEKILLIKEHYPEVFQSSLKYIGKKNLVVLSSMIDISL